LSALEPIMRARFQMCKHKHFDGVEADNVDGYTNSTGFALSGSDQLTYNKWLARTSVTVSAIHDSQGRVVGASTHSPRAHQFSRNDKQESAQALPSFSNVRIGSYAPMISPQRTTAATNTDVMIWR
jgi:Glycoside-hydrolase family GH114